MPDPLLEPAVLVSENCRECRGTGGEGRCAVCEGQGRLVTEVPMSEAWQMMQDAHGRLVAPPPSVLREQARATP